MEKERIIEEVTGMFFESGVKSIRMDDIAAACGISKRTLYENFSDREDLIRQCLWYHFDKYIAEVGAKLAVAENAIEEFWFIFGYGSEFRSATKMVIKDLAKFYPQIFADFMNTHHAGVIEDNRKRFERGQGQGLILKNIDTAFLARNMSSYLYGLRKDFEDIDMDDMEASPVMRPKSLQFSIMLYLRGLTTEKGRKYIDETILAGLE